MLTMSPSAITVSSGMPWQMTSFSERAQGLRVTAVAERARVGAVVAEELVPDPVKLVGGDARRDVPADLGKRPGGERPATRIRSIVSASLTSGSPVLGTRLPTYSGVLMFAGTGRSGEIRPGWSMVAMI